MKNIKALILDDEELCRSSLFFLLETHCPHVEVVNISSSVKEATAYILENEVNIVFLDIAMPKENGFVLIPLLQEKQIMAIFTTAFDKYSLKAIKASAVDYLLKPIDLSELISAVDKATTIQELKSYKKQYLDYSKTLTTLTENLEEEDKGLKKLTIGSSNGFRIINLLDIIYIEGDGNYCIFHLIDGEKVVASRTLKDFETLLNENNFLRIHKSYVINIHHLIEFKNNDGMTVKLTNELVIQVSRRKIPEFLEKMKTNNLIEG